MSRNTTRDQSFREEYWRQRRHEARHVIQTLRVEETHTWIFACGSDAEGKVKRIEITATLSGDEPRIQFTVIKSDSSGIPCEDLDAAVLEYNKL